jgi:hypothetical protein
MGDLEFLLDHLPKSIAELEAQPTGDEAKWWAQVARNIAGDIKTILAVLEAQKAQLERYRTILRDSPAPGEAEFDRTFEHYTERITSLLKMNAYDYQGRAEYHDFALKRTCEPDTEDMKRGRQKVQWNVWVSYKEGPKADTPTLAVKAFIEQIKSEIRKRQEEKLGAVEYAKAALAKLEDM